MKVKLLPLILMISLLSFCTKDDTAGPEYFAFGTAYGFCAGNCANFFIIRDGSLYPDEMDYYYGSDLKFRRDPLSKDKYELAKKLVDYFPQFLKKNPNKTFGCPDCADQGGIHIERKVNGEVQAWHIDTNSDSQPDEIREYIQEMTGIIQQLK